MSKPPIYERGVPQQLREEFRHRCNAAISDIAIDALVRGAETGTLIGLPGGGPDPVERDAWRLIASLASDRKVIIQHHSREHAQAVVARARRIIEAGES